MDMVRFRKTLRSHIIQHGTTARHKDIPAICTELGLPVPDEGGTKYDRMLTSFDAIPDSDVHSVAERFLKLCNPIAADRNEIQDFLWDLYSVPDIPKRFRREIARAIDIDDLFLDGTQFDRLLERLWVLDADPLDFFIVGRPLRSEIEQHVHRNIGDWSTEYLFDRLGAFDSTNRRFILFIEGLSSSAVLPDENAQRMFVNKVNAILIVCGVELRESDTEGGYPVFTIVSNRTMSTGRPKNLIFGSSEKPDIRFKDAINNDIEIVTNKDKVLVYDRPISIDGLRWRDLQKWWSETNCVFR